MPQSTESFSDISPFVNSQSDAVSRELKVLSERPAPIASPPTLQAPPTEQAPPPTPTQTIDQRPSAQNDSNLPGATLNDRAGGTLNDRTAKSKEESHLGWFANDVLNIGLAGAAIVGAEAIGAVVFRSPKLATMALETASGTTKIGLAAAESAPLASKFAYLTADRVLKSTAIVGGTYGSAIVARHYGYEALTGHEESWKQSAGEFGKGLLYATLARQLVKWSDKIWPAT